MKNQDAATDGKQANEIRIIIQDDMHPSVVGTLYATFKCRIITKECSVTRSISKRTLRRLINTNRWTLII